MGMEATFIGNRCLIYQNGRLVLTGERAARTMYHLNIRSRESANLAHLLTDLNTAHQRMGHADRRKIQQMFTMNLVKGLNLKSTTEDNTVCRGCAGGKMHKTSYRTSTFPKANSISGRIHSDVCGPIEKPSLGGALYFFVFKDKYSGWTTVNFMKMKTEVLGHLKNVHAFFKNQTGSSIKILRSDQGSEYINRATKEWIQEMGIIHETSVPYTPEQKGHPKERTERSWRALAV